MVKNKTFEIGYDTIEKIKIGDKKELLFIGGPCAIESRDHALFMAEKIKILCDKLKIKFVYKSCYDKDCRSSTKL